MTEKILLKINFRFYLTREYIYYIYSRTFVYMCFFRFFFPFLCFFVLFDPPRPVVPKARLFDTACPHAIWCLPPFHRTLRVNNRNISPERTTISGRLVFSTVSCIHIYYVLVRFFFRRYKNTQVRI